MSTAVESTNEVVRGVLVSVEVDNSELIVVDPIDSADVFLSVIPVVYKNL